MKASERNLQLYLEDVEIAMSRILEYTENLTYKDFELDYKTTDAVIRNFEVIGEASKNLPKVFKSKNEHIPWEEMYRMRNRVTHEYFGVDFAIMWQIIENYLPQNLRDVRLLIERIENSSEL